MSSDRLFSSRPAVIGVIHVGALPGTPRSQKDVSKLVNAAVAEAEIYRKAGIDGVIVENMHDRPYLKGDNVGPDPIAMMTRLSLEVRRVANVPCGVQVLAGANEAALAVALAAELDFIRAEGFVFSHVADEGWIDACAGDLLRTRKRLNADHIHIWTDIKKKHSAHAVTADVSLAETAEAAAYNLSDALIVTGSHTGHAADPRDLLAVQQTTPNLPVYIGSGMSATNVGAFKDAHGFIVGSTFKEMGYWENALSEERIRSFIEAVRSL